MYKFRGKEIVELMILAPTIVPGIAVVLGIHSVFIFMGLNNSIPGVILVHLVPTLPYMVLVMAGIFANYDASFEAQARSLGASPLKTFWYVTLPAIMPGIIVGGLFAFLVSWSQYILTLLIGGGRVVTLPLLLFNFATLRTERYHGRHRHDLHPAGDHHSSSHRSAPVRAERRCRRLRTDLTHVSIKELTKVYPGASEPSLDRLSLEIPTGELTALLGPSGCGKTTTMKMIAGLLEPTSGDVTFDGRSILKDKPENRGVVMVFQNYLLFPYMSVAENIGFGLKMRKKDPEEIKTPCWRNVGAGETSGPRKAEAKCIVGWAAATGGTRQSVDCAAQCFAAG